MSSVRKVSKVNARVCYGDNKNDIQYSTTIHTIATVLGYERWAINCDEQGNYLRQGKVDMFFNAIELFC